MVTTIYSDITRAEDDWVNTLVVEADAKKGKKLGSQAEEVNLSHRHVIMDKLFVDQHKAIWGLTSLVSVSYFCSLLVLLLCV